MSWWHNAVNFIPFYLSSVQSIVYANGAINTTDILQFIVYYVFSCLSYLIIYDDTGFALIRKFISCRGRDEPSSSGPKSKACREKMRRDKLNDRYGHLAIYTLNHPFRIEKVYLLCEHTFLLPSIFLYQQSLFSLQVS